MKKSLLIVYPHMAIGGSTTSLLSILNLIDYSRYDVDLLLGEDRGELLPYIPEAVHHLPQAMPGAKALKRRKMCSIRYIRQRLRARGKRENVRYQYLNYENARMSRRTDRKYDVAIAFLETYACYYVADFVNADRKLFWLHLDYAGAGFDRDFDHEIFERFDRVVLVSEACRESFVKAFPQLSGRAQVVENILSAAYMHQKAEEPCPFSVDKHCLNLISVCRIDFKHKGLDRGVRAMARLKESGIEGIRWYIVGSGADEEKLRMMIDRHGLQQEIVLLGAKINPAPYVRQMDGFFLPSRYEGKPMAVTEAMMLGVPPVVARYASAEEQIISGENGLIVENDEDSICEGVRRLAENREILRSMKAQLLRTDLTNSAEMEKIYDLLEKN